jgi:hypothetical protein
MVRIKDMFTLIASLVKSSSFRVYYCHIPSSSSGSSKEKYTHGYTENPERKKNALKTKALMRGKYKLDISFRKLRCGLTLSGSGYGPVVAFMLNTMRRI